MGSTNIEFVSYAHNIDIYCITQLLVNGKRPVNFVYNFPVSGSARPIAANTEFEFYYLRGEDMFPSPVLGAHYLLIWCFSRLIQMSKDSCLWFY